MKRVLSVFLIAFSSIIIGCGAVDDPEIDHIADDGDEIGTVQQALMWQFESIERDDNGSSWTMYYMYTIDVGGTVCGGANDYIVHYNRAGAYANRAKLRLDAFGLGGAQCALNLFGNKLSTRVYDDNHVWACAGKTRVDACGGPSQVFPFWGLWQVP